MIKNILDCNKEKKVALALGFFDAIHLGHQSIFDTVKTSSAAPSVFTFANNIYKLLAKDVKEIYSFEQRCNIIQSYGIEDIYYIDATQELLNTNGEAFLDLLTSHLDIELLACGEDYRYGVDAMNDTADLAAYCGSKDIQCVIKQLIMSGEYKVSSTKIRECLSEGRISEVNSMLGRPYSITAKVVEGRKSGRTIGFPTINMPLLNNILSPKFGVYSSRITIDSREYRGVTNIGAHPTFEDYSSNIETYIICYEGDLYGETVTLKLRNFLREISRYPTFEDLKKQISLDVRRVAEEDL